MQRLSTLVAVALFACGTTSARADETQPVDGKYLTKASSCIQAAIEIGKLAEQRATSPKVKEFAEEQVKHAQKCQEKVAKLGKETNAQINSRVAREEQSELDRLGKLNGTEFDREYLNWVIKANEKGIAMCEHQSKNGTNAEIRSCADEALTTMREHAKKAKELLKNLS